jgi:hypothetical protein
MDIKTFITLGPGPNVIKLFMSVIYKCPYKARVFIAGKPFQPSLMFASQTGAYPSEAPEVALLQGRLLALP